MGQKVIVHVFSPEDIQTVYRCNTVYQEKNVSTKKSDVNIVQFCFFSVEGKWPVIPPLQETTVGFLNPQRFHKDQCLEFLRLIWREAADQFVQAMYRQQKDMSLGLGNTNGEEWLVNFF